MTDKELLEMAAKSAGIKGEYIEIKIDGEIMAVGIHAPINNGAWVLWNPLENKVDCLQMEIDLQLDATFNRYFGSWDIGGWVENKYLDVISNDEDRQRASTIAASEIGKSL